MLIAAQTVFGSKIACRDGDVGSIADVYFGSNKWDVRYLVVDTGKWLPGRKILLSPVDVDHADWTHGTIKVRQTKQQIEESPPIAEDEPVSRREEAKLAHYYQWPNNMGAGMGAITPVAGVLPAGDVLDEPGPSQQIETASAATDVEDDECETDLRSAKEVRGYHIEATDGDIGHVEDFVVDDENWIIRYLVINTRNWLPGRSVLVVPRWAESISWATQHLRLGLTREAIQGSPEFDPSTPVNRQYEERLYDYYGREKYWA